MRKTTRAALLPLALLFALPAPAASQPAPSGFQAQFLGQFNASARKLVALAEAFPEDRFDWRPADGVASVAEAFMHIARYNYYYPATSLGITPPVGMDYERLEGVVSEKAQVVAELRRSMDHVRTVAERMSAVDLEKQTRLYGRDVAQWAVLLQLITHMNEHLGQEIAYARMNGVVPPWSR